MGKKLLKKVVKKKLSTGHTIELVATDVKMLRSVYEYMAGFVKRGALMKLVGEKKAEVDRLGRMLGKSCDGAESPTTRDADASDADDGYEEGSGGEGKGEGKRRGGGAGGPQGTFGVDLRTEEELTQDRYYQCKEELRVVDDKVVSFNKHEHRISVADLDAILKVTALPTHSYRPHTDLIPTSITITLV